MKRIERALIAGIAALAAVAGIGLCVLLFNNARAQEEQPAQIHQAQSAQESPAREDIALAQRSDFLPDGIRPGERLPVTEFKTKDGAVRDLDESRGKKLVLLFWGSWCPYCEKALRHSDEFARVLRETGDCELILIDKLDERKGESVKKAEAFLAQNGIGFECLYDEGLRAYDAYGLKLIPTALVLDEEGYLRAMTIEPLDSGEALLALLKGAENGGDTGAGSDERGV